MNEAVSGLIQMNAKMVMQDWARGLTVFSAIIFWCVCIFLIGSWLCEDRKWWRKKWFIFLVVLAILVSLFAIGVNAPREKIIKACASGPISMEQIAIRYDILKVDGKELTLKER